MRSIETTVTVSTDGTLTLQLPADIPPGQHRVVLVIDERIDLPSAFIDKIDAAEDPILGLGSNPVVCDLADAAENHDRYLYNGF